jgi:hypothetical protein
VTDRPQRLPATVFGGRMRTSTLALILAFATVMTGWLFLRPTANSDPYTTTVTTTTVRSRVAAPTRTPRPVRTPTARPSVSPSPALPTQAPAPTPTRAPAATAGPATIVPTGAPASPVGTAEPATAPTSPARLSFLQSPRPQPT